MEDNKNTVTNPAENKEPKPGTKDYLAAENGALKAKLESLEAQATENAASLKTAAAPEEEAPQEKLVKIRIPRTKADQEDVPVWVNERSWLIKRGVEVEVPECVAEVLRHQEEMLENIMLFEDAAQNKNK
jgi:hypothetical protein